jgi:hypothetical protein
VRYRFCSEFVVKSKKGNFSNSETKRVHSEFH